MCSGVRLAKVGVAEGLAASMGPILAVSYVFQQPVAPTMAEGARKSDLSRQIPAHPPHFIKNSFAVPCAACAVQPSRSKSVITANRCPNIPTGTWCMPFSAKTASRFATLVAVTMAPEPARAQPFEQAPTFAIERIRGFWPTGDNYSIKNPVLSDGLLRIYTLTTPYGEFTAHGDQMLRMRINELAALYELEKIANSESYGKALLDAGLSPFRYTGRLIADPKKTVGDTFSGIGTMFGRISSDLSNIGKTPGDPISGLLGVTDLRRKLATKVRVDPYTDFSPLDAKLSRLGEAAAAGGLTVSAVMMAAPTH